MQLGGGTDTMVKTRDLAIGATSLAFLLAIVVTGLQAIGLL